MVKSDKVSVIVFDSGIGGLNVLNACVKRYPHFDYIYAADNFNVPYGMRSAEEVFSLATAVLDGAMQYRPTAIVVACNTVTAECIERLRERYPVPIVGMQPAVKEAAKSGGKCAVLVTEATAQSSNFRALVAANFPSATVCPCPDLAAYIEGNIFALPEVLPKDLVALPENCESIVLGCTHYVYLAGQLSRAYCCRIFDGIDGTSRRLGEMLGISDHRGEISGISDHCLSKTGKVSFYCGNIAKNRRIYSAIFGNQPTREL